MADQFYSLHNDETSFLNYSTCAQPTDLSNPISTDLMSNVNCFAPSSTENNNGSAALRYLTGQNLNKTQGGSVMKYSGQNFCPQIGTSSSSSSVVQCGVAVNQHQPSSCHYSHNNGGCFNRNRYMPYNNNRSCTTAAAAAPTHQSQFLQSLYLSNSTTNYDRNVPSEYSYANVVATTTSAGATSASNVSSTATASIDSTQVTLQINNLDYSMDEVNLRNYLLGQLKPITPVVSLVFEGSSYAKVTVPDLHFAKQVVANLHRKKVGHKRMIVSYTRDSSLTEINTLRCQVAGLLKDVPYCTLPMYKFRELFQSRFKTSISVLDLYKMQDICSIAADKNEEKFISLQPELIGSIENSPLIEGLQHSVPYCTVHFQREQHKGWAEQEIEPLPNVFMTISDIKKIIYPLLKSHHGDIPVASLVHCICGELSVEINRNENGVNLEHLICCVSGIQITTNNFGIKILGWLEPENAVGKDIGEGRFNKNGTVSDPLYQISREVVELVKMSPKSTMKFNRFIPAYHNHFGKQCRVADYGYTKLIELFESLASVIQIMGDGENRQITLTHRTQIRRFTSDLLRILRAQGNKSILLSQLSKIFTQTQNRIFDVTDYGVCDIVDILDGLVNSNIIVLTTVQNGKDILISIPKRKQTNSEIDKTCVFASEVVELFRNAPQYSILFQKFVRSYHYHFGFQCRLSDYGFLKLADLMEAIQGIVEIEFNNDEDKKIFLSPKVAQRVFAEQLEELIRNCTGSTKTCMKLDEVLKLHKKKFGYQIQNQTLGVERILDAIRNLPYVEILETDDVIWIICHNDDAVFRVQCYRACKIILDQGKDKLTMNDLINFYGTKYNEILSENTIKAMKHAVQIKIENEVKYIRISDLMGFLISIVRMLEHRVMSLSEIKNVLKIGVNYCFKFGYPNLYTLLCAFPDIFQVNHGQLQERSEITLVPHNELFNHSANTHANNGPNNQKSQGKKRHSLSEYNRPSKMPSKSIEPTNYFANAYPIQGKKASPPSLNTSLSSLNKENSFLAMFNLSGSNSSTLASEPNLSIGSSDSSGNCSNNTSVGIPKLWDRRQHGTTGSNFYNFGGVDSCVNQSNIFDIITSLPMSPIYQAPKPDTPPSDNMPFWIDPIWVNSHGENKPPKVESLNIRLPELKTFNIVPMLMSPYTMSKNANMKNMFSFENDIGKKIA